MADSEPVFDFADWADLPVGVRRNKKKMYEYIVSVLCPSDDDEA